jgi:hypothetical protein
MIAHCPTSRRACVPAQAFDSYENGHITRRVHLTGLIRAVEGRVARIELLDAIIKLMN